MGSENEAQLQLGLTFGIQGEQKGAKNWSLCLKGCWGVGKYFWRGGLGLLKDNPRANPRATPSANPSANDRDRGGAQGEGEGAAHMGRDR